MTEKSKIDTLRAPSLFDFEDIGLDLETIYLEEDAERARKYLESIGGSMCECAGVAPVVGTEKEVYISEDGISVSLLERNIALQAIYSSYAKENEAKGMANKWDQIKGKADLIRRYGSAEKALGMINGQSEKAQKLVEKNSSHWNVAYGSKIMAENGIMSAVKAAQNAREQSDLNRSMYAGVENKFILDAMRKNMKKQATGIKINMKKQSRAQSKK